MTTPRTLYRLFCGALLSFPLGGIRADPANRPGEPDKGRVLLLEHGGLIEGEIERVGDRYRIRQSGGEMVIPATSGVVLLPDKSAAYAVLQKRIASQDPRQRAALARWCLHHGLRTEALIEADAAERLAPDDAAIRRFVQDLRVQANLPLPPSIGPPKSDSESRPSEDVSVTTELLPAAQSLFASKVQPILINACASCHCRSDVEKFRLTRPAVIFGDRNATQRNLAAVLAVIHTEEPTKSPLLMNALAIHGGATQPPLRDRDTPTFRYLEEFVRLVTGRSANSRAEGTRAEGTVETPIGTRESSHEPQTLPEVRVSSQAPRVASPRAISREIEKTVKEPTTSPFDEYDPTPFNRGRAQPPRDP